MSTEKSFSSETSERYARALYEIGKESNELEKIEVDMKNFKSLFDSNNEIKNFIQNPTHLIDIQNKVLNILSEKLSFSKNLKNFFYY
jgi:F0F1-type ATP synthase delta subunit